MKPVLKTLLAVVLFAILTLTMPAAFAQTPASFSPDKMDTILYGAAYYTEYMPYERLEQARIRISRTRLIATIASE